MKTFEDLKWEDLRPTPEEADAGFGLCGERAEQCGVEMEVRARRLWHGASHVTHIVWKVLAANPFFGKYMKITGEIRLSSALSFDVAYEEGKQLAIKFGELWIGMTSKD